MRKLIVAVVLLAIAGSAGAYYSFHRTVPPPVVTTAPANRGDIVEAVGATGTLQAVTTVQVGSQVSGTISELHADFNSLVHKGEVLARLDPSLFQTQLEQARANLTRSQADVERLRVSLDDARTKLRRAQELAKRSLIPQSDLETAQVNVNAAEAQLKSSQAQVIQAQASLNQSQVSLDHTVILAPIDGIVVSRNVDVGQTVAASMQAPTLFILAADLTKMQVVASLDESDVGRIRPGQVVHFRVDAYPTDDFIGSVTQLRLQPQVVQNVVSYSTVIAVPNPELKLKPGMTANVNIEIARRTGVIRVPSAALRFRPTNEMYAALGQTPPEPAGPARAGNGTAGGQRPAGGSGQPQASAGSQAQSRAAGSAPAPGATRGPGAAESVSRQAATPAEAPGARSGGVGAGSAPANGRGFNAGGAGLAERMQNLSPEERTRVMQRMRDRSADPAGAESAPAAARGRTAPAPPAQTESLSARNPQATTIDALFGPLPPTESTGRVWLYENGQLKAVRVRLGISDGQASELLEGAIEAGAELVTNISLGEAVRNTTGAFGGFPGMGQPGRGGPQGGAGRPAGGGGGAPGGR
jgi:HlyD family secretion protein